MPAHGTRYVAFLRAINVGGRIVKMDRLRALFADMGLANVESFIASGNILFDSTARATAPLEGKIEKHLESQLGYAVDTFVRPLAALESILARAPSVEGERPLHALYIGFMRATPSTEAITKLMSLATPDMRFAVHGSEIYWQSYISMADSPLTGASFEKIFGAPVTFRNANTVRKLELKSG